MISGQTWIGRGANLEEWQFTLLLPKLVRSVEVLEAIDWTILLPPENKTRWLALDTERKRMEIEPGAAVPDLA